MNLEDLQKLSKVMAKGVGINIPIIKAKLPNLENDCAKPEPLATTCNHLPSPTPEGILHIKRILQYLKIDYVQEFKFCDDRKFRFDFYIEKYKIGIEYDGIFSEKSRHTTAKGFTMDCEKMNLSTILGYKIFRYTILNYKDFEQNLKDFIAFNKL